MLLIEKYKNEITEAIKTNKFLIITSDTGTGKSTKIPQFLYTMGNVLISQPRRIPAISISSRVSAELSSVVGDICGYKVRYNSKYSLDTKILYVTEGVLLNNRTSLLKKYTFIILDEIHERSCNIDMLLWYFKNVLVNSEHRLVMMSATGDIERLSDYFYCCPVFNLRGGEFRVEVKYQRSYSGYVNERIVGVVKHLLDKKGDILVFLSGIEEINTLNKLLEGIKHSGSEHGGSEYGDRDTSIKHGGSMDIHLTDIGDNVNSRNAITSNTITSNAITSNAITSTVTHRKSKFDLYKLHSSLQNKNLKVFLPSKNKKIILSTNISETSLTIKGIKYVIDTGKVKKKRYDTEDDIEYLEHRWVSKDSCVQRSGRAGRVEDGICYRMFSESEFESMDQSNVPEIMRSDLCDVTVKLFILLNDPRFTGDIFYTFNSLIDVPHSKAIKNAMYKLKLLDLVRNNSLTADGAFVSKLPVHPILGKLILEGKKRHREHESIALAAMIDSFYGDSEILTLIRKNNFDSLIEAFYLKNITNDKFKIARQCYTQILRIMELKDCFVYENRSINEIVEKSFYFNLCRRFKGTYFYQRVYFKDSAMLRSEREFDNEFIIFYEIKSKDRSMKYVIGVDNVEGRIA